jgi:flagellar biosynthetic protein FliR
LCGFLLTLPRVASAFSMVPLPGVTGAPTMARTALSVGFTLALAARWPAVDAASVTASRLIAWVAAEAAVGLAIGVAVTVIFEVFNLSAQVLGLQAGYAYASTIDPNTQADAGILLVLAQLTAGLLFFTAGLDREVLRLFARSLDRIPPGQYLLGPVSAQSLIHLGASIFSVGLRLAMPVVALLVMVDIALALLGRVNAQLQLLTLAFPVKMLAGILMLSWVAVLFPRIFREISTTALGAAGRALGL